MAIRVREKFKKADKSFNECSVLFLQELPSTMRAVTSYNGVKWIHDYQDACVDKIDRFIRGDNAITSSVVMDRFLSGASSISGASSVTYNRQNTFQRTISSDSTKAGSTSSDEAHTFSERD